MKANVLRYLVPDGRTIFRCFLGALAAGVFFAVTSPAVAAEPAADYAAWTKSWVSRPSTNAALGDASLKAVVSIVAGEKELSAVTNMTPVERLDLAYHLKISATDVATNGSCHCYFVSNTGSQAEPRQLSPGDLQKLDEALSRLPDDHAQLPPPGKRVVVQVWEKEKGAWHVRVYDGKHLPPEVKAVLDLLANPCDKYL